MNIDKLPTIEQLEETIRNGNLELATQTLNQMNFKKLGRKLRLGYANIARRVHCYHAGIKILNPIIRPKVPLQAEATEPEKIEYAELLRKIGAIGEAEDILSKVDPVQFPESNLMKALCCFSKWEYDKAIPFLIDYVNSPQLTEYNRMVGQLNLAAAYTHNRQWSKACALLMELREKAREKDFSFMLGHILELSAQVEIKQEKWLEAQVFIEEAEKLLGSAGPVAQLWVKKWKAIMNSRMAGKVLADLLEVKASARQTRRWETIRDCDFQIASIEKDSLAMDRVYFGTPYLSYRKYIIETCGSWYRPNPQYSDLVSEDFHKQRLNLTKASIENGQPFLQIGQVPHRLLVLLAEDSYRPLPVVSAFSKLFPEEYYNPISSGTRVHQGIKRLRAALKEHNIDIDIITKGSDYHLKLGNSMTLMAPQEIIPKGSSELLWASLEQTVGSEFSIKDVKKALGVSDSSGHRLLKWAIANGKIEVLGSGPKTRYQKKPVFTPAFVHSL